MHDASELARRLAARAEAVCRHYLPDGRRQGRYWLAGDVTNAHGRSLFVRLAGPCCGSGAAGKWTDAATGQHGDLLDLIGLNRGHTQLSTTLDEARLFLGLPEPLPPPPGPSRNSADAARRLFHLARPVTGTLAETYLRRRGITAPLPSPPLRFHPRCYYRESESAPLQCWPALIAAITDLAGNVTGVHRTYLARDGADKAPLADPRRALGHLLGFGVRLGHAQYVLAAGEGLETMLALRSVLPALPAIAALSAGHLPALTLPAGLRRLYIAADNDPAGHAAAARLALRARDTGIEVHHLVPPAKDWNDALRVHSLNELRAVLLTQLAAEDASGARGQ